MKAKSIFVVPLLVMAADAQAHVAETDPIGHALEHGWLLLLLLPVLGILVPLLRRRRSD